jgi:rubrerythrin
MTAIRNTATDKYIWLAGLVLILLAGNAAAAPDAYTKTIEALQDRYADEMRAHQQYGAYARHALQEGYPNIAHLFRALAASEAVHARNFATLLEELGVSPQHPEITVEVSSTRRHLQQATDVEAAEIDTEYPAILERIREEGHHKAIESITWAWKAEQQHREMILKIRKAASIFFGLLVSRIEGDPSRYYVCQICGSTLSALPDGQCPICNHAAEHYQEVPGFPGAARQAEEPSGDEW